MNGVSFFMYLGKLEVLTYGCTEAAYPRSPIFYKITTLWRSMALPCLGRTNHCPCQRSLKDVSVCFQPKLSACRNSLTRRRGSEEKPTTVAHNPFSENVRQRVHILLFAGVALISID